MTKKIYTLNNGHIVHHSDDTVFVTLRKVTKTVSSFV